MNKIDEGGTEEVRRRSVDRARQRHREADPTAHEVLMCTCMIGILDASSALSYPACWDA